MGKHFDPDLFSTSSTDVFLAKSEGKSIDPKCSFVKKELNNDSEHKTLIYQDNTKEEKNSENSK